MEGRVWIYSTFVVSGRLESDGLFLCPFPKQASSMPVRKSTDPKLKETSNLYWKAIAIL